LVNNLDQLAEDRDQVLARVKEHALQGNRTALTCAAKEYGLVRTRKFFNTLAADNRCADRGICPQKLAINRLDGI
jgi:hypothetical protein